MKEKLSDAYPHLLAEWDDPKDFNDFTKGSKYQARWKCDQGHEWESAVGYRIKGYGSCLSCISIGYLHPELIEEWDTEKNTLTPFDVRAGSGKKVWWKGKECHHSWEMEARSRVRFSYGCPYCSGQRVLEGFNDFQTTHPELARQWDDKKNKKTSTEITYGLKTKVWWTDTCGHSWSMSPLHRTRVKDSSCPICRSVGVNYPELIEEWDDDSDPFLVLAGSRKKVAWKCSGNPKHKWKTAVHNRGLLKQGCPYCSGRRVTVGDNDLATTHPHLIEEWADERDITEFSFGSNVTVKWECEKGHKWKSPIQYRTDLSRRCQCLQCWQSEGVSQKEKELFDYVNTLLPGKAVPNDRKILSGKELDIYVPEKKLAIEYNGLHWHSEDMGRDRWYHYNKWNDCRQQGIDLLTVWEDDYARNPDLVRRTIAQRLGVLTEEIDMARDALFQKVSDKEANLFLEKNHLQEVPESAQHYGLRNNKTDDLVATLSVDYSASKKELRISSFAASKSTSVGFTTLLNNVLSMSMYAEAEKLISHSQNEYSEDVLYENNGFERVHSGTPSFSYIKAGGTKREHYLDHSGEDEERDLNESELAIRDKLYRIWDCGHTRWEKAL